MDRWKISIKREPSGQHLTLSADVMAIGDWHIRKGMLLQCCLLGPLDSAGQVHVSEKDGADFFGKPVGGRPMSETIIRMREKVLVGRRGNAFFRRKKLSMSRNFLSQPCKCGEYEQKA